MWRSLRKRRLSLLGAIFLRVGLRGDNRRRTCRNIERRHHSSHMRLVFENRRLSGIILFFCIFAAVSCGGGGSGSTNSPQVPVPASQPTFAHVAVVVLENHSYSEVIGNSSMPYLNGLAQQYGLAAQYFGN